MPPASALDPGAGTTLICYAHDGRERWRFIPGREVRTVAETFLPPFRALRFVVARLGKDHAVRIVVTSQHYLYYPCQVALLARDGTLLREYWHSGGLPHVLIDHGRIILAGVHNATKTATLVALNPDTMTGASIEENPSYQLQGFSPGQELARLFFPRRCMNTLLEPFVSVARLWTEPGEIVLETEHHGRLGGAAVFYHLNADLTLKNYSVGSSFEHTHNELHATHVLDHDLTPKERAALAVITYEHTRW